MTLGVLDYYQNYREATFPVNSSNAARVIFKYHNHVGGANYTISTHAIGISLESVLIPWERFMRSVATHIEKKLPHGERNIKGPPDVAM